MHQRYCWALHDIPAMWIFGQLDVFLLKWQRASHCSKVIPKLINCSECSGKWINNYYFSIWSNIFVINIKRNYYFYSILKTPTDDIWPGVTCLPDYKETFPCWTSHQLKEQVCICICIEFFNQTF